MNHTMQKMAESDGLKLLERLLVPLLVAAVIGGFGLVLRGQSKSDKKIDELTAKVQDQAVSAAVYRERVDKLQLGQAALRQIQERNTHELDNHDYRIGSLEKAAKEAAVKTRPVQ